MESSHNCEITRLYKSLGINIYSACDIDSSIRQYAAIDAHIDNLELPLIANHSFCGVEHRPRFCIDPSIALRSSILAIIGTYAKTSSLIFFTSLDNGMLAFLNIISNIKSQVCPGTVVSVCENKFEKNFRVTSHDTGIAHTMNESDMIVLVTSLIDTSRSMTFYLDSDSDMYATYMHNSKSSMWVSKSSRSIQPMGTHGSEVMPMLYDIPSKNSILRLNAGQGQMKTQNFSILESQINATNSSIMSAVSKDNLCYCCAYMKKVHEVLCSRKIGASLSFEAKLLISFFEETE